MDSQSYIVLGLTFITGVFAGVYFYVTVYAPQYASDDVAEKSSVVIEGEMYGGCVLSTGCASFRLTENGSYQYFASAEAKKESGRLPSETIQRLLQQLETTDLARASSPKAIRDCVSYVDGIDYRYSVTFEGGAYTLDTCTTNFSDVSHLQIEFIDAWEFMTNPTTTYPVIIEKGVGGFIIDRLQNPD